MRPYHHREPGVAGAALGRPDVACSIIADHIHLHPAVIDQVVALKGPDRVALVTDAISAAGATGAAMTLGDRTVQVVDGAPRLDDGTLAGSVLAMDQAVRNIAARWGLEQAARMAAATPAQVLGLDSGEIRLGAQADLVLLDRALAPTALVVGGVSHALSGG
jgi:N-acetylglucosamine-6-phosphate deacetylase